MITDFNSARRLIKQTTQTAFIVGNGINRHAYKSSLDTSWSNLLLKTWDGFSFTTVTEIGQGISFTEFYDILEMESTPKEIRESIISEVKTWQPTAYHKGLVNYFQNLDKPILTTNFDFCLGNESFNKIIVNHPVLGKGFTDYYPWNVVYTDKSDYSIKDIYKFGIWHINGNIEYPRSLKLSLSEYTRQSKRAVELLHSSNSYEDDFYGKNKGNWKGMNTWLHILFNCNVFIFGLGLDQQETFLRWMLIERMKYFRKHKDRKKKGWYICQQDELTDGKRFFLERVGFEIIALKSYEDIYNDLFEINYPKT